MDIVARVVQQRYHTLVGEVVQTQRLLERWHGECLMIQMIPENDNAGINKKMVTWCWPSLGRLGLDSLYCSGRR